MNNPCKPAFGNPALRDTLAVSLFFLGLLSPMKGDCMPQDSTIYYQFVGSITNNITSPLVGMGPTSPTSIYEFNTLVYPNSKANADPLIRPSGSLTSLTRDRGGAEWIQANMSVRMTTDFMWGGGGAHGRDTPGYGLFRTADYTGTTTPRGWTRVRFNPGSTKSTVSQPFAVRRSVIPLGSYPENAIRNRGDAWATSIPLAEMGTTVDRLLFVQAIHISDPDLGSNITPFNQAANNGTGNLASAFSVRGANFNLDVSRGVNSMGSEYDLNRGWITAEYRAADCSDGLGSSALPTTTNVGSRSVSAQTWNGSAYATNAAYTGCAGYKDGTYVFESAGDDIWNASDTFRYGHRSGTGNKEIRVRIDQLENTSAWARAGIMIREGTTPGARNVAVFLTPSNGVAFQSRYRSTSTEMIGSASTTATKAPVWLRLRYDDASDVTRAYYSPNGTTWTQVGTTGLAAGFSNYQMGLASASRSSYPHTTVFSNFTYTNTLSAQ
jgi:hypothetical protein